MNPVGLYDIAKERQRDLLREARRIRASKERAGEGTEAARSSVRHGVAQTLRRVADTLEPVA